MTASTEDLICKFLLTLSQQFPLADTVQWRSHLTVLAQHAEAEERERVLDLFRLSRKRISKNKGRGWEREVDELESEIEYGTQLLFQPD